VLVCDIGAELDILPEIANVASNFMPWLQGEWDHWDEAEGEPLPPLENMSADVAAVLALHSNILIPFQRVRESMRANRKAEGHCRFELLSLLYVY